jgi:hypothetical protein
VVQVGVPPNRIDLIQTIEGASFDEVWKKRDCGPYGKIMANWIDIDSLITVKERIDAPRHQSDVRELRMVREIRARKARKASRTRRVREITRARKTLGRPRQARRGDRRANT